MAADSGQAPVPGRRNDAGNGIPVTGARFCRVAILLGYGLAVASCLVGCVPAAVQREEQTFSIDFQWRPLPPDVSGATQPLTTQAPAAFTISWNPAAFTAGDVRFMAEQQCLAWNTGPREVGKTSASNGLRVQRFACDVPITKKQ